MKQVKEFVTELLKRKDLDDTRVAKAIEIFCIEAGYMQVVRSIPLDWSLVSAGGTSLRQLCHAWLEEQIEEAVTPAVPAGTGVEFDKSQEPASAPTQHPEHIGRGAGGTCPSDDGDGPSDDEDDEAADYDGDGADPGEGNEPSDDDGTEHCSI